MLFSDFFAMMLIKQTFHNSNHVFIKADILQFLLWDHSNKYSSVSTMRVWRQIRVLEFLPLDLNMRLFKKIFFSLFLFLQGYSENILVFTMKLFEQICSNFHQDVISANIFQLLPWDYSRKFFVGFLMLLFKWIFSNLYHEVVRANMLQFSPGCY